MTRSSEGTVQHHRTPIVAFAAGSLLAMFAAPANAGHDWNGYHWARTSASFTLKVVDSVTPDWQSSFDESLTRWGSSSALDLTVANASDSFKVRKQCSAVAGSMRVCNAAYGANGWLGLAQIAVDSQGHITRGLAKMNDTYSSSWSSAANRNHVMCQEIGHVLGLGHTSEDGSSQQTCMDYSSDVASQWPNAHDFEQLAALYAHADAYSSYDTGGTSGGGGGGPPCAKKQDHPDCVGSWGERVHADGAHEVYVRPSGDGIVITHVRLADERAP